MNLISVKIKAKQIILRISTWREWWAGPISINQRSHCRGVKIYRIKLASFRVKIFRLVKLRATIVLVCGVNLRTIKFNFAILLMSWLSWVGIAYEAIPAQAITSAIELRPIIKSPVLHPLRKSKKISGAPERTAILMLLPHSIKSLMNSHKLSNQK